MVKCPHGRSSSYYCKPCGGKGICEHGKRKDSCRACGGSLFCEHGMNRNSCHYCPGKGFCPHGVMRAYCRPCGGSAVCPHTVNKSNCHICNAWTCTVAGCEREGHKFTSRMSYNRHMENHRSA